MSRSRLTFVVLASALAVSSMLAGCGDDGPADAPVDATIALFDASIDGVTPVDAAPSPDAFECSPNNCETSCCSNVCTNTASDDFNCNACGEACTVGTHCEASACGECRGSFLASVIDDNSGTVLDLRQLAMFPAYAGFSQFPGEGVTNGYGLLYAKSGVILGQAYNLSVGLSLPQVLAAYDGNLLAQTFDTAYGVSSGSVLFTAADADCVSGTLTKATFVALSNTLPPTVAADGCSFTVESLEFAIGDCAEPPPPDAGVPPPDASVPPPDASVPLPDAALPPS